MSTFGECGGDARRTRGERCAFSAANGAFQGDERAIVGKVRSLGARWFAPHARRPSFGESHGGALQRTSSACVLVTNTKRRLPGSSFAVLKCVMGLSVSVRGEVDHFGARAFKLVDAHGSLSEHLFCSAAEP